MPLSFIACHLRHTGSTNGTHNVSKLPRRIDTSRLGMKRDMAIWTYRYQVRHRVNVVLAIHNRQRDDMVHLDNAAKVRAISLTKIEPAYGTDRTMRRNACLARLPAPFKPIELNLATRTFDKWGFDIVGRITRDFPISADKLLLNIFLRAQYPVAIPIHHCSPSSESTIPYGSSTERLFLSPATTHKLR